MTNSFSPKIAFTGHIQNSPFSGGLPAMQNLEALDKTQSGSFKDMMSNIAGGLNNEITAPDKMMTRVMAGDTDVDIHDVTTAMAKAEMSISVATQITSKVIQAYDKIMQISV